MMGAVEELPGDFIKLTRQQDWKYSSPSILCTPRLPFDLLLSWVKQSTFYSKNNQSTSSAGVLGILTIKSALITSTSTAVLFNYYVIFLTCSQKKTL